MAVTASPEQSSPAQSILCTGTKQEPNWSRFHQTKAEMSLPTDGRINFEPENTTQSSWCSDSNPPSQIGLPCPPGSLWDNSLRSQNYPDKLGLPYSVPLLKFFPLFGMSFLLPYVWSSFSVCTFFKILLKHHLLYKAFPIPWVGLLALIGLFVLFLYLQLRNLKCSENQNLFL